MSDRGMRSFARAITILSVLGAGALVCAGDQPEGGALARTTLTRYCLTCHNEKLRAGGMALSPADWNNIPGEAKVWEKVIRKLRTKTMPPAGLPRPDEAGYDALASYLENEIDRA